MTVFVYADRIGRCSLSGVTWRTFAQIEFLPTLTRSFR